jgi:hypothetical protein
MGEIVKAILWDAQDLQVYAFQQIRLQIHTTSIANHVPIYRFWV